MIQHRSVLRYITYYSLAADLQGAKCDLAFRETLEKPINTIISIIVIGPLL